MAFKSTAILDRSSSCTRAVMIFTVILSSLRYARIRDGGTRSVPAGKSQIAGVVPAQLVLKGDQRVIGLWDSDGVGPGSDCRRLPFQIAPQQPQRLVGKATGRRID
jgi:hypothetical protein